jgi:hypothetical protein
MRTTLDLPEDVLDEVKKHAARRSITNGKAAAELILRGLNSETPTKRESGLLIFAPGPGSPVLSLEKTLALEDQSEADD